MIAPLARSLFTSAATDWNATPLIVAESHARSPPGLSSDGTRTLLQMRKACAEPATALDQVPSTNCLYLALRARDRGLLFVTAARQRAQAARSVSAQVELIE